MNIYLTYDYELFFGHPTGTAEKCIVEPTEDLLKIASNTGAKLTFFVDVGYIKQLKAHLSFQKCQDEFELITQQIKKIIQLGHDCQLHIHPHWEDSYHDGSEWIMKTDRYKLADFSKEEADQIIREYHGILYEITNKPVNTFRAGGWCLQPFSHVQSTFKELGIKLDTTVFKKGKFIQGNYYYDFSNCPEKDAWRFEDDLCKENSKGSFLEIPIGSAWYSPLFFWKLFFLGRWNPKDHKPIGNGYPMPSPGLRKTMLTKGKLLSASSDGYFVTKLPKILTENEKRNLKDFVIIGHPKANTQFALKKLEEFILSNKNKHDFVTFQDRINSEFS